MALPTFAQGTLDWGKIRDKLKSAGVALPANDAHLLGVALMNLGLLSEDEATWVRDQRVTPGKKSTDDPLSAVTNSTDKPDKLPSYDDMKDAPKKDVLPTYDGPLPDGVTLPTNQQPNPADVASAKTGIQNVVGDGIKRGPHKVIVPGVARDGVGEPPPAAGPDYSKEPRPLPPGWTPPPPMEYKRSPMLTPEEFKALPRERQLQLLSMEESPGTGGYNAYGDPQRGYVAGDGQWYPFDYSGYAGLVNEMGRKVDWAERYGEAAAGQVSQQMLGSLDDAAKGGDKRAEYIRANLKQYFDDPGRYGGPGSPTTPIEALGADYDKQKAIWDRKAITPEERAARRAEREAKRATRFGDPEQLAEGTVDLDSILPMLEQILAAVSGGDGMPSFDSECEEDDLPTAEATVLVAKKPEEEEEDEDEGLPRFATGTIGMGTDSAKMPEFKPEETPPTAPWLKEKPVQQTNTPAEKQTPVTVNVNVPNSMNGTRPPHTIAIPGESEPAPNGDPNRPRPQPNPAPQPDPQPQPNPQPDPAPNDDPILDGEDGPGPNEEDKPNDSPIELSQIVGFRGATTGEDMVQKLNGIFGGNAPLDPTKVMGGQDAIAQILLKVAAGLMTKEEAANQIWGAYQPTADNEPPADTPPGEEEPPTDNTPPDDPAPDEGEDELPAAPSASFDATDIAYLNQLSKSQMPSWKTLARSYLASRGVPLDGVTDDQLTANIENIYAHIREKGGVVNPADVLKVARGEPAEAPESGGSSAASSMESATAPMAGFPEEWKANPPNRMDRGPQSVAYGEWLAAQPNNQKESAAASSLGAASAAATGTEQQQGDPNTVDLGGGFILDKVRNVIIDTATGKEYKGPEPSSTDAPTQIIYGPDAWKNNPTIRLINQLLGASSWGKLGNLPSYDPLYKTSLAAPNALNYGDMLQVLQDPTAAAIADAVFKRHNRSLTGDVIRAGAFAPLGDARYSGEIKTG